MCAQSGSPRRAACGDARRGLLRIGVSLLLCVAAVAGPGAAVAAAATISLDQFGEVSALTYTAEPGEENHVVVSADATTLVISDPGVTITDFSPPGTCVVVTGLAQCSSAGIVQVDISLADLDDTGSIDDSFYAPLRGVSLSPAVPVTTS